MLTTEPHPDCLVNTPTPTSWGPLWRCLMEEFDWGEFHYHLTNIEVALERIATALETIVKHMTGKVTYSWEDGVRTTTYEDME